jgi:hypothetical protein
MKAIAAPMDASPKSHRHDTAALHALTHSIWLYVSI